MSSVGTITVAQNMTGGEGASSGSIFGSNGITSVKIGKAAIGTSTIPDDRFGIFAQHIVELKVNGVKQKLGPVTFSWPSLSARSTMSCTSNCRSWNKRLRH